MELDHSLSRGLAKEFLRHVKNTKVERQWVAHHTSKQLKQIQRAHDAFCKTLGYCLVHEEVVQVGNEVHDTVVAFSPLTLVRREIQEGSPTGAALWEERALEISGQTIVFRRRQSPTIEPIPCKLLIGEHALTRVYQRIHGRLPARGEILDQHAGLARRFWAAAKLATWFGLNPYELFSEDMEHSLLMHGGVLICEVNGDGVLVARTALADGRMGAKAAGALKSSMLRTVTEMQLEGHSVNPLLSLWAGQQLARPSPAA